MGKLSQLRMIDQALSLTLTIKASAMYGYDSAFIGGTIVLPSFQRAFGLDSASDDEIAALSSNIVSTFQAGAFFGAIPGFFLAEKFGRKPTIMGSAVVFIIGVVIQMIGKLGLLCKFYTCLAQSYHIVSDALTITHLRRRSCFDWAGNWCLVYIDPYLHCRV